MDTEDNTTYTVFVRNWWKRNPNWPDGLEPGPGPKKVIRRGVESIEKARRICEEYNRENKPGKLSRKAEFTSK